MITDTVPTIIDRLSAEHAEVAPCAAHLVALASSAPAELRAAIEQCAPLRAALDAHIAEEDGVVFPAIARAMGDSSLVDQFTQEHRDILDLRRRLFAATSAADADARAVADLAYRLGDLLASHMLREDEMLFPSARQALA